MDGCDQIVWPREVEVRLDHQVDVGMNGYD